MNETPTPGISITDKVESRTHVLIVKAGLLKIFEAYWNEVWIQWVNKVKRWDKTWIEIDIEKIEELCIYSFDKITDNIWATLSFHLWMNRIVDAMFAQSYNDNIYTRDYFTSNILLGGNLTPEQLEKRWEQLANAMVWFAKAANGWKMWAWAIPNIVVKTIRDIRKFPDSEFYTSTLNSADDTEKKLILSFIALYGKSLIDLVEADSNK